MSVTYIAYAVLGLEVDPDVIYGPEPQKTGKFNPNTGRAIWTEEKPHPALTDNDGDDELAGYRILNGGERRGRTIVAIAHVEDGEYSTASKVLQALPESGLQKFKDAMNVAGVWDDSKFGIHALLYVS